MSISNFSQKRSPTEDFLKSLERDLNFTASQSLKAMDGLNVLELIEAKFKLAFDLEEVRINRIRQFCDGEDYRHFHSNDPTTPFIACLAKKWQNTTVFDKKVVLKRASNPDLLAKRKSEMLHAVFNPRPDPRKSLHVPAGKGEFRKSFFENVDVRKMKCSRVIGLGLTLTGTKKSRDYSAIQNEFESVESKPTLFGADDSSNDDFVNSVHSGDEESEDEFLTEDKGEHVLVMPVLSIVKQNKVLMDLHGGKIKNVANYFSQPTQSYSLLNSESHRLSLMDSNCLVSWVFHQSQTVKTFRVSGTDQLLTQLDMSCPDTLYDILPNSVIVRNSEDYFKDENCGSGHRFNSIQGLSDRVCFNSHNFNNSIRCYSSLPEPSRSSKKENRVLLSFPNTHHFNVSIEEGFYGAFVNLGVESFWQKLLIDNGMVFLTNEKKGLGVHQLISPSQTSQREDLIRSAMSSEGTYLHCANLKLASLSQFLEMLKQKRPENSSATVNFAKNSCANVIFKQFFLPLLSKSVSPIVVLSKIEFHQNYQLFQWKEKAIVFQIDFTGTDFEQFFESVSVNSLDFIVGETLFKSQGETKYRNPVTSFLSPFDLLFSFHSEVDRFSVSYPRKGPIEFCNLFDSQVSPLVWHGDWQGKPGSKPITQEDLIRQEGIWVSLSKTDFLEESLTSKEPVHLPYGTLLMINQIVYLVSQLGVTVKLT